MEGRLGGDRAWRGPVNAGDLWDSQVSMTAVTRTAGELTRSHEVGALAGDSVVAAGRSGSGGP